MKIKNKFIIKIYSKIFKKWLFDSFYLIDKEILEIRGWKSFLVKSYCGRRESMTVLFPMYDCETIFREPFKIGIDHLFHDCHIHVLHIGFLKISWCGYPYK